MSAESKKSWHMGIRFPAVNQAGIEAVAARLGITPSDLARIVLLAFVEAYEAHGKRIVWPPEYLRFAAVPSPELAAGADPSAPRLAADPSPAACVGGFTRPAARRPAVAYAPVPRAAPKRPTRAGGSSTGGATE